MASTWHPIETAPKDGRRIYVRRVHNGTTTTKRWAWWGTRTITYSKADPTVPDQVFRGWLCDDDEGVKNCPTPTHWQPDEAAE